MREVDIDKAIEAAQKFKPDAEALAAQKKWLVKAEEEGYTHHWTIVPMGAPPPELRAWPTGQLYPQMMRMKSTRHDAEAADIAEFLHLHRSHPEIRRIAFDMWHHRVVELSEQLKEGDVSVLAELLLADREACRCYARRDEKRGRKSLYELEHGELLRRYVSFHDKHGHTRAIDLLAAADDVSVITIRRRLGFVGLKTKAEKQALTEKIRDAVSSDR